MIVKRLVPDTGKNVDKCKCPSCPTRNQCMKDNRELLFCARRDTKCDLEKKGCLCGTCPIWALYTLNEYYWCDKRSL